jgi:hypothetical protein
MHAVLFLATAGLAAAAPFTSLSAEQQAKLLKPDAGADVIEGSFIVKLAAQKSVAALAMSYNATQVYNALPSFPGFAADLNDDQLVALLKSSDVLQVEPDMVATTNPTSASADTSEQACIADNMQCTFGTDKCCNAPGSLCIGTEWWATCVPGQPIPDPTASPSPPPTPSPTRSPPTPSPPTTSPPACANSQTDHSWGQARTTMDTLSLGTYYHEANWGIEVDVYVIDTGTRCSHEEFRDGNCVCGPSFSSGDDGCSDGNGHGTHCAGTVGGKRYGVAKNANIIGVKVLPDSGGGSYSAVIAGVNYAAEQSQVTGRKSLASMSLGGPVCNSLNEAVNAATEVGCLMVVASGNDNADACRSSPGSAEGALNVGATTDTDARASYSNWGSCVDIFAPGSGIISAFSTSDTAYTTMDGTSMATPHVAGVVAALYSIYPDMSVNDVKGELHSLSLKNVVTNPGTGSPNELLHLECLTTVATPSPTPLPKCSFAARGTDVEGTLLTEVEGLAEQGACCDACEATAGCEAFSFAAEIAAGDNEYELAVSGSCESHTNGRCSTAANIQECEAARDVLRPDMFVIDGVESFTFPIGCFDQGFGFIYFNQIDSTTGTCSDFACLCTCEAIPASPSMCRLFKAGEWNNVGGEDHVTAGVLN